MHVALSIHWSDGHGGSVLFPDVRPGTVARYDINMAGPLAYSWTDSTNWQATTCTNGLVVLNIKADQR